MKKLLFVLAGSLGLSTLALAQPTAGRIQYEVAQKMDLTQARIVINGQVVKPGSPDFPADIPDVRTFGMSLAFAGGYAREERENTAMRVVMENRSPGGPGDGPGGGAPQMTKVDRPFEETNYVNLANGTTTTVLTIKKDGATTAYRTSAPQVHPADWKEANQTKKIAGYTCHKATVPYKGETYTVWYTTDLPFTYSPIRELAPEKGVVLVLEGAKEQYRASKVDTKASVAAADVQPNMQAKEVTPDELKELREKTRADFRQKMMEEMAPGGN